MSLCFVFGVRLFFNIRATTCLAASHWSVCVAAVAAGGSWREAVIRYSLVFHLIFYAPFEVWMKCVFSCETTGHKFFAYFCCFDLQCPMQVSSYKYVCTRKRTLEVMSRLQPPTSITPMFLVSMRKLVIEYLKVNNVICTILQLLSAIEILVRNFS